MAKVSEASTQENKKSGSKMDKKNVDMAMEDTVVAVHHEKTQAEDQLEASVSGKLSLLYSLQLIDSQIDKIRVIRGELPLEVQDLADEIEGLKTRVANWNTELDELTQSINQKNNEIVEAQNLIKRYEQQQQNVRNNREFDSLTKEIEFQTLEIELCKKRIFEFTAKITTKKEMIAQTQANLNDKESYYEEKNKELAEIILETEQEEQNLLARSADAKEQIEDRLLMAYERIRKNARNGLAVVRIERDACGGCFNKIAPQKQLEIRLHKKIIICEFCGRVLVDDAIANSVEGIN